MPARPRILFLARELGYGGAERQLILLARGLAEAGWDVLVATFYAGGAFAPQLEGSGVRHHVLEKRGRWDLLGFARSLSRLLRTERPDVVHSYLDVPNVVAAVARGVLGGPPLVWGVRASSLDWSHYEWMRVAAFQLSRPLSRIPRLIIANSEAGRLYHTRHGYPTDTTVVVRNGVDLQEFRPDAAARDRVRSEWEIGSGTSLVGIVGRLDPMKGHETFIRAATRIATARPDVRFAVVGGDAAVGDPYAHRLHRIAAEAGLEDRIIWAPSRRDAAAVFNALDVLVMASRWGEGFPNVLAEGMASGCMCVATDCGDAAVVVEDLGEIVGIDDDQAMALATLRALALDPPVRRERSVLARQSIERRFSPDRLVSTTGELLRGVISN